MVMSKVMHQLDIQERQREKRVCYETVDEMEPQGGSGKYWIQISSGVVCCEYWFLDQTGPDLGVQVSSGHLVSWCCG